MRRSARNLTKISAKAQNCVQNIVDPKKFELKTPDVSIKVSPEKKDLVETRVIDGVKFILVRADGGVELNGVNIEIK